MSYDRRRLLGKASKEDWDFIQKSFGYKPRKVVLDGSEDQTICKILEIKHEEEAWKKEVTWY